MSPFYRSLRILGFTSIIISSKIAIAEDIYFNKTNTDPRTVNVGGTVVNSTAKDSGIPIDIEFTDKDNLFLYNDSQVQEQDVLGGIIMKPVAIVDFFKVGAIINHIVGVGDDPNNLAGTKSRDFKIFADNITVIGKVGGLENMYIYEGTTTFKPTGIDQLFMAIDTITLYGNKIVFDSTASSGPVSMQVGNISSTSAKEMQVKTAKDHDITLDFYTTPGALATFSTEGDGNVTIKDRILSIENNVTFNAATTTLSNQNLNLKGGNLTLGSGAKLVIDNATAINELAINTINTMAVQASATADLQGLVQNVTNLTIGSGATVNLRGWTNHKSQVTNLTVTGGMLNITESPLYIPNITIEAGEAVSRLTGPYTKGDGGVWKVRPSAHLEVQDLALANQFTFESGEGSLAAALIIDGDANFATFSSGFQDPNAAPSAIIIKAGQGEDGSPPIDRTVTLGGVRVNTKAIVPGTDNTSNLSVDSAAIDIPKLGAPSYNFKKVTFTGDWTSLPITYAKQANISNLVALSTGVYSFDELQIEGALILGQPEVTLSASSINLGAVGALSLVPKIDTSSWPAISLMGTNSSISLIGNNYTGDNKKMAATAIPSVEINGKGNILNLLEIYYTNANIGTSYPINNLGVGDATVNFGVTKAGGGGVVVSNKAGSVDADAPDAGWSENDKNFVTSAEEYEVSTLKAANSNLNLGLSTINSETQVVIQDSNIIVKVEAAGGVITNGSINSTGSISGNNNSVIILSGGAHIPDNTSIQLITSKTAIPTGFFEPVVVASGSNTAAHDSTAAGKVNINSINVSAPDVPFSDIEVRAENEQIKIVTRTNPEKVNEVGEAAKRALDASEVRAIVNTLMANIDTKEGAAKIMAAIKKFRDDEHYDIREFVESFTDQRLNLRFEDEALNSLSLLQDGIESLLNDVSKVARSSVPAAGDADDSLYVWSKIFGGNGKHDATSNFAGFTQKTMGMIIGAGKNVNEKLSVGTAFSLSGSNFLYQDVMNGDKLATVSGVVYLYGNYHFTEQVFLRTVLDYGCTNINSFNVRLQDIGKPVLATSSHLAHTLSGSAKIGYLKHLNDTYDLTVIGGMVHSFIFDEAYSERGADHLNFVMDSQKSSKTIFTAGISLLANYEKFTPEVHANIYRISDTAEAAKFGFEWLSSNIRFTSEQPLLPKMQYNLGFNLAANLANDLNLEAGADLYFSHKYYNTQIFLSTKYFW